MIKINLLPYRAQKARENVRLQVSVYLLSLVMVCLGVFGAYSWLARQIRSLEENVAFLDKEVKTFEEKAKEVDTIKKQLEILQKKNDVMVKLDTNRKGPVEVMDLLTQMVIENRMWIEYMTIKDDTLAMRGMALDEKTTADFMKRFESRQYAVTLNNLAKKTYGNQTMHNFDILCKKIAPPAPQQTEKKQG
jgi:type IV pilus assembly protein PilN